MTECNKQIYRRTR